MTHISHKNPTQDPEHPAGKARVRWFAIALVLVPVVALAGALLIGRSDWFLVHGLPPYLRGLESEFTITGRACDVLVFGDSSALTGIEPRLVSAQTGLHVCSIAQTKGVTGVTGTSFIDMYLRRNPAPRLLVIAFAPEDWHEHANWGEVAYVEGVMQLLRHYPAAQVVRSLATHPDDTFGFATFVYKHAISGLRHAAPPPEESPDPSKEDGHMTLPLPTEESCVTSGRGFVLPLFPPDPAYMARLRAQYTTADTQVLLVVSPVPDCDLQRGWYLDRLRPYADGVYPAMPVEDFNDIDRHFTRAGSAAYSKYISQLILSRKAAAH